MKISFTLFAYLIGTTFAAPIYATPITRDLVAGSGDALLTYDPDSGLEWLDTTITAGRSFTEVDAGWGGWTTSMGFRYATIVEVQGLAVSAGVMPNFLYSTAMEPGNSIYVDRITALTRFLGPTVIYEDEGSPYQRRSVLGYVSDDYSSNPDYANYGRYAEIGFYELGWTTQAWVYDGSSTQVYRDSQYGTHGSFLVRDSVATQVPEPKTLALSGAALLALLTVRRKKKPIS